jgi:hypothetical protein
MSISLGSSTISNIYLGSTAVSEAYLGSTLVFGGGPTPITLPSGAVVVYDFSNAACWPGSGRFVYDLSGNAFTGSLYDVVGSGSAGALNFDSANARLEHTSSVFNSAMTQRKAMFVGVQYQTGSINGNTGFASTWGGTPDLGYAFFMNAGGNSGRSSVRHGIQLYNSAGTAATGYYADPASYTIATGSASHTYYMMANAASGSSKIYNNNVNIGTLTGLSTSLFFVYNGTATTANGFKLGNFVGTGQNFRGNLYKAVIYNRPLSDAEIATVEAWMTGSN